MAKRILYELAKNGEYASFYTRGHEQDKFTYGKVLSVNELNLALHLIDPDGEDDGILVLETDPVIRVETDGKYSAKMKKLQAGKETREWNIDFSCGDILVSVLSFAEKQNLIVSVELCDAGYAEVVGVPQDTAEGECKVMLIDEYGEFDGYSYISLADITSVSLMSDFERRLQKLAAKD